MNNLKYILPILFLAAPACMPAPEKKGDPETVWMMQNGIAVIEVESVEEGDIQPGYWEPVPVDLTGFTGSGAFIWKGDGNSYRDPLVYDAPGTDGPYRLTYQVMIPESGDYLLRIRNYHLRPDGDNDAWLGINHLPYQKIWDHDTLQWTWNEATANMNSIQHFPLNKGINTFDIVGRSKGWAIDRIVIYIKGTPEDIWQNLSHPEASLIEVDSQDKDAPSTPRQITLTKAGMASAHLSWQPVESSQPLYGYLVYLNDQLVQKVTMEEIFLTGLSETREYEVKIQAKDFAGNLSHLSNTFTLKTRSFEETGGATIPGTKKILIIDGEVEEGWMNIPEIPLTQILTGDPAVSAWRASFRMTWDDQNLYLLVQSFDNDANDRENQRDALQLFFDPDLSKSVRYGYGDRIYQFSLARKKGSDSYKVNTARINREAFLVGLEEERIISEAGYLYELAIPWSTLGKEPLTGSFFGFDMKMENYRGNSEKPYATLGWYASLSDRAGSSPYDLGNMKLVESCEEH